MTEVGLSGPTKLLISRENERAWRVSLSGGPSSAGSSKGRAGNQRDQCESSDKCLHHISPCLWITVRDTCGSPFVIFLQQKTDALCFVFPKEIAQYSLGK